MNSNLDLSSKFRLFYKISLFLSILIFLNLLYGPLVRATGSGLACPDWPFCFGKIFPTFDFQIFMEVSHRYYSGFLGLILLGLTVWTFADKTLRKEFGIYLGLAILLLISQINLGRLTVTLKLDPTSVNLHLLNAIAFFLVILTVSIDSREKSVHQREIFVKADSIFRKDNVFYFLLLIGIVTQIVLGGRVSSHYAGLACPDFPTCWGEWIPNHPLEIVKIQVIHRFGAYSVAILLSIALGFAILKNFPSNAKRFLQISMYLLVAQIILGILNVFFGLPKLVTALHTGFAVLLLTTSYLSLISRAVTLTSENERRPER
ncbi:COX15/CtaA family protein [Leptospira kmetyi]|uniref:Cytochrome oxidase assembly protein n=1 Tax=Leptospira kmetyi TaxID=408139 RepID=A0ABX4NDA8_9LEPT|nr:COX15/CtaA family protein [Leptospira kmetyi]PJZ30518.1 cytochrome oxidase assembly protein [Leptospira kmetyi]TGK16400.1 heme A synthase [Leptospira kmetyi]TGK34197.1 heme A synthase [Leptospira kmetyi]TGL66329.1 heme A synthase [Leptospira kmetyi]